MASIISCSVAPLFSVQRGSRVTLYAKRTLSDVGDGYGDQLFRLCVQRTISEDGSAERLEGNEGFGRELLAFACDF